MPKQEGLSLGKSVYELMNPRTSLEFKNLNDNLFILVIFMNGLQRSYSNIHFNTCQWILMSLQMWSDYVWPTWVMTMFYFQFWNPICYHMWPQYQTLPISIYFLILWKHWIYSFFFEYMLDFYKSLVFVVWINFHVSFVSENTRFRSNVNEYFQ